jgi:hypothetical protein
MEGKRTAGEDLSKGDSWRTAFWFLACAGTIFMFSYEYVWSRFVLRNPATISFGDWIGASAAITTPWTLCLVCLIQLREAVKNGKIGRDVCMEISVWVELVMIAASVPLALEIQRLASLGALK